MIKIFLDGPALERMIGGNTEMEVQVRHQIAKNFAKRYLSDLLEKETREEFNREGRKLAVTAVKELAGVDIENQPYWNRVHASFSKLLEQTIDNVVRSKVEQSVKSLVQAAVDESKPHIEAITQSLINDQIRWLVRQHVEKVLNTAWGKELETLVKKTLEQSAEQLIQRLKALSEGIVVVPDVSPEERL